MSIAAAPRWQQKRTDESRMVEAALKGAGFATANAYRHNSASLRVRVIDERFRGMAEEEREKLVDPVLDGLPSATQADIINLLLMYPGEEKDSFRVSLFNAEFENGESGL